MANVIRISPEFDPAVWEVLVEASDMAMCVDCLLWAEKMMGESWHVMHRESPAKQIGKLFERLGSAEEVRSWLVDLHDPLVIVERPRRGPDGRFVRA